MKKLDFKQMEMIQGGISNPDQVSNCSYFADRVADASMIISFAAIWTGGGGLIAFGVGAAAYALSKYC
jgi:hypothetical protein